MKMIIVKLPTSPEGMKLKQLFLEYLKSQIEQKIHPTNERTEISELAHIFTFVTEKSNSFVGFQRFQEHIIQRPDFTFFKQRNMFFPVFLPEF